MSCDAKEKRADVKIFEDTLKENRDKGRSESKGSDRGKGGKK